MQFESRLASGSQSGRDLMINAPPPHTLFEQCDQLITHPWPLLTAVHASMNTDKPQYFEMWNSTQRC